MAVNTDKWAFPFTSSAHLEKADPSYLQKYNFSENLDKMILLNLINSVITRSFDTFQREIIFRLTDSDIKGYQQSWFRPEWENDEK